MAVSDSLLILVVGFRVKLSNEDIAEMEGLKDVAMATAFVGPFIQELSSS